MNAPDWALLPAAPVLMDESYQDATSSFRFILDADKRLWLKSAGKGTMAGARAMLDVLKRYAAEHGQFGSASVLIDLSDLNGGPLRSQLMFGKWLFKNRDLVDKAAIAGAGPVERRIATGVMTIARLTGVRFFKTTGDALEWLGLPRPEAPT